jgi:hypothetical protein
MHRPMALSADFVAAGRFPRLFASPCSQLGNSFGDVGALGILTFSTKEHERIYRYAVEGGIDLWRGPATG